MGEPQMSKAFEAVKLTDNVYWVGVIDWDVRNFHGYLTSLGTTYNAYLVVADKVALIDTVKEPFYDEMMARISSVIEPGRIDYIVSNHSELDHTGCLPQTIAATGAEQVFASKMGAKALACHFHDDQQITVVGDGDSLDLGGCRLSFVETRMCHWPDSMVSYLHEAELLFSQDVFGMHMASSERFADELDRTAIDREAAKYYANILMPFPSHVRKILGKLDSLGVPVGTIAPDHGPIWRTPDDAQHIINAYRLWADRPPTNKAVVLYDTMWQSTAKMARAVGQGLEAAGMTARLMSMDSCHRSDVAVELLDAGALVVGSPTMNNNIFPTIADVMTYIKGLKPRGLVGAAFGSHGWSGDAPKHLHQMLEQMGIETVSEPLMVKYVPDDSALVRCRDLGYAVGSRLSELLAAK